MDNIWAKRTKFGEELRAAAPAFLAPASAEKRPKNIETAAIPARPGPALAYWGGQFARLWAGGLPRGDFQANAACISCICMQQAGPRRQRGCEFMDYFFKTRIPQREVEKIGPP